ncbi:MAG TPA: helix-turn-helix domain-containing protein [Chloroflexota bacterium]|nr:helix-turn-helix domain-containing protein [Chloroflexota bacterium]
MRAGLSRLLAALSPEELEVFCAETLGRLAVHDLTTESEILPTLEIYAGCGSVAETARQLATHRNTVRHRIARAEALLGARLDDPDLLLRLGVALRAQRILGLRRAARLVQTAQTRTA